MTPLGEALRKKYRTPLEAIRALGLDEALLTKETTMTKPTRLANLLLQFTARSIKPILAKDAKIDLMPIFKDVTSKTFDAKKITMALDSALKGKLAKDASMEHVAEMLDHLEHVKDEKGADESVSEEQHKAMEAAAHGTSNLGIPKKVGEEFSQADKGKGFDAEPFKAFLKEKGMGDEDIAAAMDMVMPKSDADDEDETEEEKKAAKEKAAKDAEEEKKKAEEKAAADKKARDEMVTKPAMDAAIKSATDAAVKTVRETERGVRAALAEVRPWVGELPVDLAFDSAEAVKRHALGMIGVDGAKTLHADALSPVLAVQPKPGARAVEHSPSLGMDEQTVKSFNERFPGASRIGAA